MHVDLLRTITRINRPRTPGTRCRSAAPAGRGGGRRHRGEGARNPVDPGREPQLDAAVNGAWRRLPALLLLGVVLVAAGCTDTGRDAEGSRTTGARPGSPPATRSAAYGSPCLRGDERAAAFRFQVGQGFDTVGVVLGEGRSGLVFGHERGSNLCEWVPTARAYARLGYRALVFDFHDQDRLDDDVVAAVGELRRRGVARILAAARGLYGATASRDKQLLVLSSAAHGTNLLNLGREGAEARAVLRSFITAHLDR
jgi:hypothetical protein